MWIEHFWLPILFNFKSSIIMFNLFDFRSNRQLLGLWSGLAARTTFGRPFECQTHNFVTRVYFVLYLLYKSTRLVYIYNNVFNCIIQVDGVFIYLNVCPALLSKTMDGVYTTSPFVPFAEGLWRIELRKHSFQFSQKWFHQNNIYFRKCNSIDSWLFFDDFSFSRPCLANIYFPLQIDLHLQPFFEITIKNSIN